LPVAAVNDTDLFFETAGDSGPPVLLVMGLRARGLAWLPIVDHLSRDHQVVWYDHRGIGGSKPLTGPTSMAQMAGDAVGLMDHLGWGSAHVAGVSMGGMVSQHIALDHAERVRSVSFIVTTAHGRGLLKTNLNTVWRYSGTFFGSREKRLTALARLLYSAGHLERVGVENVVQRLMDAFGHDHPGTARAQVKAVGGHDTRARLSEVRLPSLVIGAGSDCIVPEWHGKHVHGEIDGSDYLAFPHAAHGVIAEESEAVSARIAALIDSAEGRQGERHPAAQSAAQ
jgi:3-oxoadipate enol-lactonase